MARTVTAAAFTVALFLSAASPAVAAQKQPQARDLAPIVQEFGGSIDRLQAFEIGGVAVLRGRTADRATAEAAGRHLQLAGFSRVANLIQVIEAPDDRAIQREAERELALHRSLDGCAFRVDTVGGVVRVGGRVHHELQKDIAIAVVRNIDGVREVRTELTR